MKKELLCLTLTTIVFANFSFSQPSSNCPPEGRGKLKSNGSFSALTPKEQALNVEKNRRSIPKAADYDNNVNLASMLNSNDSPTMFNSKKAAHITGYIFKANPEKQESCNCNSNDPNMWDTHIYISDTPITTSTTIADCVVIEVTPFTRTLHPDWTTEYINQHFKGKKVTVSGWLLHDFKHTNVSYDTNPTANTLERHTAWEIHPIVDMK